MGNDCDLKIDIFTQGEEDPVAMSFSVRRPSYNYIKVLSSISAVLICLFFNYMSWPCRTESKHSFSELIIFISSITVAFIVTYKLMWWVQEETVLLTVPFSIQLTTNYSLGRKSTSYIPWQDLKDLAIIEVISGQRVLFYLAVLLKRDSSQKVKHILLFKNTKPRLVYLEQIYRQAQQLIDLHR